MPAIVLVDPRDRVRGELHNFFEARGYNLLEAATPDEAVAVAEMRAGLSPGICDAPLDLLIGGADAGPSVEILRRDHPGLAFLKIVDHVEHGPEEIRWPFTEQALLEKVEALLKGSARLEAAAP